MEIINQSNFSEKIKEGTVLVDFFADWCGPCKMIAPELEKLSAEYAGKANIYKVNVDADPALAQQFNISSIPNLCLFKDGQLINQVMGWQDPATLKKIIEGGLN